ncbi:hypothetical protein AWB99_00105 [Mycolicibacterium confluentis]|nr:hypothetical protein AWB99_00105 [Mycolicibacterium confluentis]
MPQPDPVPQPAPGFVDGFRDRWFANEAFAKSLFGTGDSKSPGVLESWQALLGGLQETISDPVGAVKDEIDRALNSPSAAYYLGEWAADGTQSAGSAVVFGPETFAARAALGGLTHETLDSTTSVAKPAMAMDGGSTSRAYPDTPTSDANTSVPDHSTADIGYVVPYGVEDTGALLTASENAGGHLIERHVGRTFDDLSARLDSTKLGTASSFNNLDEAAAAVGSVLQRHQQEIAEWLSSGADLYLRLDAPFNGGSVLVRGDTEAVPGTGVKVVLKGDGNGGWYVLTGFPTP